MAYGDYDGPDKPDKGLENGSCNRRLCQAPRAIWWNHGSHSWYCDDCRDAIQFDPVNLRGWLLDWQPRLGHPQFETREQMDARERVLASVDTHPKGRDAMAALFMSGAVPPAEAGDAQSPPKG